MAHAQSAHERLIMSERVAHRCTALASLCVEVAVKKRVDGLNANTATAAPAASPRHPHWCEAALWPSGHRLDMYVRGPCATPPNHTSCTEQCRAEVQVPRAKRMDHAL